MGGGRLRAFAGDVQGCFFHGVRGCCGGLPYLVEASGGVRICSGLFRFVRGAGGVGHYVALSFCWGYGSTIGARRLASFLPPNVIPAQAGMWATRGRWFALSSGVRGGAARGFLPAQE